MRPILSIALVLLVIATALAAGWFNTADRALRDLRFGLDRRAPTGQIVFVDIDKVSLEAVGSWPWPRSVHADILERLLALGATQVAFDLDLSAPSSEAGDLAFEQALADADGRVILTGLQQLNREGVAASLTLPLSRFAQHATIAGVNVATNSGGGVRRIPYEMGTAGTAIPPLPIVLAAQTLPEGTREYIIDYSIVPGQIDRISVAELLAGNVEPQRIENRKVVVSTSALELRDVMMTPIDGPLPGGLIQILAAETMLLGRTLQPPNLLISLLVLSSMGVVLLLLRRRLALWPGIFIALGASAAVELMAFLLQSHAAILIETVPAHLLAVTAVIAALALEAFERRRLHVGATRQHTEALLRIAHAATYDAATGVLTRLGFIERVSEVLEEEVRVGMVSIRLDRFERVVATLGSRFADQALTEVVRRLSTLQPLACGRIGGQTFVLLLSEEAVDTATEQLPALLDSTFTADDHRINLSATIGIALSPYRAEGTTAETLLNRAEVARTAAETEEVRTPVHYQRQMEQGYNEARELEVMLREALAEKAVHAHFQGQFDLATGRLCGAEALARWTHPRLGNVSPSLFIPVAEQAGLAILLGSQILEEACQNAVLWPSAVRLAVNVSPAQFEFDDIPALLKRVLSSTGLDPERLDIEITEGLVLKAHAGTFDTLKAIRAMGVGIALDDFGTGYSSLSYLGTLPINQLKIDQSFVRRLAEETRVDTIVEAIISLCAALKITVVAEGIETEAQAAWLRSRHCAIGQGYLFHRPASATDFAELADRLLRDGAMPLPLTA